MLMNKHPQHKLLRNIVWQLMHWKIMVVSVDFNKSQFTKLLGLKSAGHEKNLGKREKKERNKISEESEEVERGNRRKRKKKN